jgi:hypothetical protein
VRRAGNALLAVELADFPLQQRGLAHQRQAQVRALVGDGEDLPAGLGDEDLVSGDLADGALALWGKVGWE